MSFRHRPLPGCPPPPGCFIGSAGEVRISNYPYFLPALPVPINGKATHPGTWTLNIVAMIPSPSGLHSHSFKNIQHPSNSWGFCFLPESAPHLLAFLDKSHIPSYLDHWVVSWLPSSPHLSLLCFWSWRLTLNLLRVMAGQGWFQHPTPILSLSHPPPRHQSPLNKDKARTPAHGINLLSTPPHSPPFSKRLFPLGILSCLAFTL